MTSAYTSVLVALVDDDTHLRLLSTFAHALYQNIVYSRIIYCMVK